MQNLTAAQKTALQTLAQANGLHFGHSSSQAWLGFAGQLAKEVVYTPGQRKGKRFQVRLKSNLPLAREMASILGV